VVIGDGLGLVNGHVTSPLLSGSRSDRSQRRAEQQAQLVVFGQGRVVGGAFGDTQRDRRSPLWSEPPYKVSCKPTRGGRVKLSARNQLRGTVTSINRGEAIANVVLDVAGQRLVASITVEAVEELGLREGANVTAIVKASDVIIGTRD
jgi:molybdopterin-binding protein